MNKLRFHKKFGEGTVVFEDSSTTVIRFKHGIEECQNSELSERLSPWEAFSQRKLFPENEAILKLLAELIISINDSWGVFSCSRIDLLPHQLWVCNRVLRNWPTRMLVADDVGLGKTIEAGLILWPLIASGRVKRLLILTPAPLVEQWQERMRIMFDIRLIGYNSDSDTQKADFWNTANQVVASLPTMRADNKGRHERILSAEPWDMVIVDEAHHMFAHENSGKTLAFQLFEKMEREGKIISCVLFTGTPHRGKDFGFWSLMSLVSPLDFDPRREGGQDYSKLSKFMIRNCKQKVTDMSGKALFQDIKQYPELFYYNKEESAFYTHMSEFILSGKAYADKLDQQKSGQVTLVLIALQKLASSSIAAVSSALKTRKKTFEDLQKEMSKNIHEKYENFEDDENEIVKNWLMENRKHKLKLMEDEVSHIDELIKYADAVKEESRIKKIISIIEERYSDQSVLLFTEYKATQALMITALIKKWGENSVGFINGDDALNNVTLQDGSITTLKSSRENSANNFNEGKARFLVSTEAAGEGIDLQQSCHIIIHIDLPWNPMRLHQRVGRINRYGQKHTVEVISLRNPETIESKIWDKLESKLHSIMKALGSAMDDPEDLLQLVLGMSDQKLYNELYLMNNKCQNDENLSQWFDTKTKTLGGNDIIETVNKLVGNASKFDLSGLDTVPRVDLPNLLPFLEKMLLLSRRKTKIENNTISFITPDEWKGLGILRNYDLIFDRSIKKIDESSSICGVGHKLFNKAIEAAREFSAPCSIVPSLENDLFIYRIFDKITHKINLVKSYYVGIEVTKDSKHKAISDDKILMLLSNHLNTSSNEVTNYNFPDISKDEIEDSVKAHIHKMNLCLTEPAYELFSILLTNRE